jgi:hypothetical protein
MESVINDHSSREIVQGLLPLPLPLPLPLANEASLLDDGIIDALSMRRLPVFQEEHFKITAGEADLRPENFDNVNTSCACLRAREPGRQGTADG